MTEYYNNTLCIQAGWLIEADIISQSNYKLLSYRNALNILRRGCRNTPALVEYDSIPDRFKKQIVKKVGDPYKTTKHIHFKDYLQQDLDAIDFFHKYTIPDGSALPEDRQKEYAANAAIFKAIDEIVNNKLAKRKALGTSGNKVWKKLAEIIQDLPLHEWPHKLPKNARRLKQKFTNFKTEGYESLIHAGFCNKNSEKIGDDAKQWLIARFADQVNRIANIEQLWVEYNEKAPYEGWKKIKDDRTIYLFLNQEDIKPLWYGYRYGELKAKEKYTYFHTTKLPSMRDSLWYSDGTKLNFYYLDGNGKMATCQVYEVMDAYSEVFLGYHISKTEDYEAQYYAYKMAAKTAGHRPYQIGFDGQGGHKKLKSGEFLTKLSRLAIRTQPYNGKSKTIENAFGRFQAQFLKRHWFFTGQNITAKKDESKANMEVILANTENLPTLKEVIAIYEQERKNWNQAIHPKTGKPRLETYLESENPETKELDVLDMIDLFWILRDKPVTYTPSGISFKEKKVQYDYVVYNDDRSVDMKFHTENIDKKFFIKFDPEDMSMIYLYEETPLGLRRVTAAETKVEVSRGRQEITQFEDEFIKKMQEANKKSRVDMRDNTEKILEQFGATIEQQGLNRPVIKGIEKKKKRQNIKKKVKEVEIGEYQKEVSNAVYDEEEIDIYSDM
ncbi:hypothetical protein ML462_13905 [Gramella lutea]|uniref:Integrase catalytic domain-containing protein n=1 Tax=Christiangramia lutea TaxID=1607951 RepID=A0A9X1V558_9FLAO|nr:hypothetical protein [Christiangramia lutea]MCH4824266.1 hypothetical protein [Christiangramia lutea]